LLKLLEEICHYYAAFHHDAFSALPPRYATAMPPSCCRLFREYGFTTLTTFDPETISQRARFTRVTTPPLIVMLNFYVLLLHILCWRLLAPFADATTFC